MLSRTGLILVTDAISAMGLAEGRHRIGQMEIEVRGGKAYVANTNTLCGSIAPMDECVKIFKKSTSKTNNNVIRFSRIYRVYSPLDCTTEYALEAASLHPALCLGISEKKGTLDFDADADFILLNEQDLTVWSTWIAGECVHETIAADIPRFSNEYKSNDI